MRSAFASMLCTASCYRINEWACGKKLCEQCAMLVVRMFASLCVCERVCLRKGVASFYENIGRIKHSKPFEMLYTIGGVVWRHTHAHTRSCYLASTRSLACLSSLSLSLPRSCSSHLNWDIFTLKLCSLRQFYVFNWKNENRRAREQWQPSNRKNLSTKSGPRKYPFNTTNGSKHKKRIPIQAKNTIGHWLSGFVCLFFAFFSNFTYTHTTENAKTARTHTRVRNDVWQKSFMNFMHSERQCSWVDGSERERERRRETTKNISFCCRFQL